MTQSQLWWQTGVVYQVYPRSFQDSNGDGIGDLAGLIQRLDYLHWLGINALWLSPIFPSPMADFGYDVSDYTGIHPLFGTMSDFDRLLAECHQRGIKLLLDFVPNHTSDEHPWFVAARSSRDNPKRDWYIWCDPKPDGSVPNNWESYFTGPAWTFDEKTGQYYLNLFDPKQADLNWRNPEVRKAMYDVLRFWFEKGVDGFRIDCAGMMIKDEQLRDNPLNPDWKPGQRHWLRFFRIYSEDLPEVQDILREMRAVADEYHERVLIGEMYIDLPRLMHYYGAALDGVHLPFNFELILLSTWNASILRELVDRYEAGLPMGAWPNWVLGNHDRDRIASRVGQAQARVAQMMLLTLRGTPTCYYGDELSMKNVGIPPELVQDPQGKRSVFGRDPERTPMQWDASPNAGFTDPTVIPWLPLAEDYQTRNVAAQREEPTSMLSLVRRLIEVRRATPAITLGSYRSLDLGTSNDVVFGYLRSHQGTQYLIALNMSSTPQKLDLSAVNQTGTVLVSTHMDRSGETSLASLELRPDEGVVIELAV